MNELRDFMFERVYESRDQQRQQQLARSPSSATSWTGTSSIPIEIPSTFREPMRPRSSQAADYVAGMTDRYALATHDRLFRPTLGL